MDLGQDKVAKLIENSNNKINTSSGSKHEYRGALPLSHLKTKFARQLQGSPTMPTFNAGLSYIDPSSMHLDYFNHMNISLLQRFKRNTVHVQLPAINK